MNLRSATFTLLIALAALLASGCPGGGGGGGGGRPFTISGTIADAVPTSVEPRGGARVTVRDGEGNTFETTTASDGSYQVSGVAATPDVTVQIDYPGHVRYIAPVDLDQGTPNAPSGGGGPSGPTNTLSALVQERSSRRFRVGNGGGTVHTHGETDLPAAEVNLPVGAILGEAEFTLTPYRYASVAPGDIPDGYTPIAGADFSADTNAIPFNTPAETFVVLPTSVHADELSPADIRLMQFIDGRWVIVNGRGRVNPPDDRFDTPYLGPDPADPARLDGAYPWLYAVRQTNPGIASGRVTDPGGAPVPGAIVTTRDNAVTTGPDGSYQLPDIVHSGVDDDLIPVTVLAPGFHPETDEVAVGPGDALTGVDVPLASDASDTATLSGTVTDTTTSAPVPDVIVSCRSDPIVTQLAYSDGGTASLLDDSFSVLVPSGLTATAFAWLIENPAGATFTSTNENGASCMVNQLAVEAQAGGLAITAGAYEVTAQVTFSGGTQARASAGFLIRQMGFAFAIADVRLPVAPPPATTVTAMTDDQGNYTLRVPAGRDLDLSWPGLASPQPVSPLTGGQTVDYDISTAPVTDTQAPSTPGAVLVRDLRANEVRLEWGLSTDDVGVVSYRVYRDANLVCTLSETWLQDIGVSSAWHLYTVTALDAAGNESAPVTLLPLKVPGAIPDAGPPTPPAGLVVTPRGDTMIDLAWSAASDDLVVSGYRIRRNGTLVATVYQPTFSDTGLTPGTSYDYTVEAFDAAGNSSAPTNTSSTQTLPTPDATAPTVPAVTATPTDPGSVEVTWGDSTDAGAGVAGYHVYRDGVKVATVTTGPYTDTGLSPSTSYTYTVRAFDAAGNLSAASPAAPVTTPAPTPSLVLRLPLDEGTGTRAGDGSGSGNGGTIHGGPIWDSGRLVLDGADDYIEVADAVSLALSRYTIQLWVYVAELPADAVGLVSKRGTGQTDGPSLALMPDGRLRLHHEVSNTDYLVLGTTPIEAGRWYFVAGTYDGSNLSIYVDGALDAQAAVTVDPPDVADPIRIGWDPGGSGLFFRGLIDDVRIYDTARTSAQIAADAGTSYRSTSLASAPAARTAHTAVWAPQWGMLVWGGWDGSAYRNDGGIYDPGSDTWTPISMAGAPTARAYHSAVWTGTEMVVWGGFNGSLLTDGARYDPATDTWTPMSPAGAPSGRRFYPVIWTGREMFIGGGEAAGGAELGDGARYDPAADTWSPVAAVGAPAARQYHAAAWTGTEMLLWGGWNNTLLSDGARYNPAADTWSPMSSAGAPSARSTATAVWTGTEMIVWGGETGTGTLFNTGGRYNPSTDAWAPTATTSAPAGRRFHLAAWDDVNGRMLTYGGETNVFTATVVSDAFEYDPASDAWAPIAMPGAPQGRKWHGHVNQCVVWTGSDLIIWGGGPDRPPYLASGGVLSTRSTWVDRTPATRPSLRDSSAMAFDESRGVVVLFGGRQAGTGNPMNDTWEWNGSTWTQRFPATIPPNRQAHGMWYDPARRVVAMFGGNNGFGGTDSPLDDTWEWNGTDWAQRTPASRPSPRQSFGVAYDSARGVAVLFGGNTGIGSTVPNAETWEWDGTTWTQQFPATSPSVRCGHGLAYDSARAQTVFFGGYDGLSYVADTWVFDGTTWTRRTTTASLPPSYASLAYDARRGAVVLFGGWDGSPFGETWEWNGTLWTLRSPAASPPARGLHATTYDAAHGVITLFAGTLDGVNPFNDTWIYPRPASTVSPGISIASAGTTTAGVGATVTITVVVRDALGNPLSGQIVTISASGGGNTITQPSGPTGADGVATATISSDVAETKVITVTVNGLVTLVDQPSITFVPSNPSSIVFSVGPATTPSGTTIAPAVEVRALDSLGNLCTGFTGNVTVSLGAGSPAGATLSGTRAVAAVGGIATFSTLQIDKPGAGYTLEAQVTGLAAITSTAFDVTPMVLSVVTVDSDSDGLVDAYRVTWSGAVTDASYAGPAAGATDPSGGFLLTGSLVFPAGDIANDAVTYVAIEETGDPNTGVWGSFQTASPGVIQAGGAQAGVIGAVAAADGAPPVLIWARYVDANGNGAKDDGDEVELFFSEDNLVLGVGGMAAIDPATELPLQVTNDSWGASVVSDLTGNWLGILMSGGRLTVPGQFDPALTVAGAPSGLDIALGGDELEDFAGNDAITQGPVDLGVSFDASTTSPLASAATDLALASVSGDGDLDGLVVESAGPVALRGNGSGTFTEGGAQGPAAATRLAVGDVDGDGIVDAVFAAGDGSTVEVREANPALPDDVQFPTLLATLPAGPAIRGVVLVDVEGVARQDLVLLHPAGTANQVFVNDGVGNFVANPATFDTLDTTAAAAGDVNDDGKIDLVCAEFGSGNTVWLGDGSGGFASSGQSLLDPAGNDGTVDVVLLDADLDGDLDAAFANEGGSRLWLNDGSGVFTASQRLGRTQTPSAVVALDFDLDGDLDLVEGASSGGTQFWVNARDGTFRNVGHPNPLVAEPQDIEVGDADSDGDADLVLTGVAPLVATFHADASTGLWTRRFPAGSVPSPRQGAAIASDRERGVVVLFGGYDSGGRRGDTWEWDGVRWTERFPATSPSPRSVSAMTYDEARGVVLLYGGENVTPVGETWEWDGSTWTQRLPATNPPVLQGAAMAYDSSRRVVVMFGGDDAVTNTDRTWEWDGNDWTERLPATTPPGRKYHGMAFDGQRRVVVMYGGEDSLVPATYGDTWEWDGTTWTERLPATTPGPLNNLSLCHDPSRAVTTVFGGSAARQTWEWDGGSWSQVPAQTAPPSYRGCSMAFDSSRGVALLFGGDTGGFVFTDQTWEYRGPPREPPPSRPLWVDRAPASTPSARTVLSMAYDSAAGTTVLFGGYNGPELNETWTWDGTAWTQQLPASSPSVRYGSAMAMDEARGVVLLFGGVVSPGWPGDYRTDTWEWDGGAGTWTERFPATVPAPASYGAAMAYDSRRQVVVMFGGTNNGTRSQNTYEWDGTDWTLRSSTGPSPRDFAKMVYDSRRGVMVLFGGRNSGGVLPPETWEWDGSTWTQRTPPVSPSGRFVHGMAYDTMRGVAVLMGGTPDDVAFLDDVWEWDGTNWTRRLSAPTPPARAGQGMAYDEARQQVVLFGGWDGSYLGDTWEYRGPMADEMRAPEPVLHFAFNEGVGAAAGDSSGRGNNGTISGGAAWTSGALVFDGVDDYVQVADSSSLALTRYTVQIRVYVAALPASVAPLFAKRGTGTTDGPSLALMPDGRLRLHHEVSAVDYLAFSTTSLVPGRWYSITGTYDGSYLRVYIDDVLDGQAAVSVAPPIVSDPVLIGWEAGSSFFQGRIDDLRIYDQAIDIVTSGPKVTGLARYLDINLNAACDAGDQVIVRFNVNVNVNGAAAADFLLPVAGDTFGTGATVAAGPGATEVTITLGANPQLTTRGTFSAGTTVATSPSGIDVSPAMAGNAIESAASGIDAVRSSAADLIPWLIDSGQALGANDTGAVALGDVDGDGDLDIVEGRFNPAGLPNRVWRNDGTGTFTDSGQALGNGDTWEVVLGDVDGDGDLDLVEGNNAVGTARSYLNNGSGTFTPNLTFGPGNINGMGLGDLDADGDLDLVIGCGYGGPQADEVWKNDGTGTFSFAQSFDGGGETRSVALADFDGDGDLDVLIGNTSGAGDPSRMWRNDGTGFLTDSGQSLTGTILHVAAGDLDGDGDSDIVLGGGTPSFTRVWLNDGTGLFTATGQVLRGSEALALADMDADGDLDVLSGGLTGEFITWNDGTGAFTEDTTPFYPVNSTFFVATGDLDGDGDPDVVLGTGGSQPDRVIMNSLSGTPPIIDAFERPDSPTIGNGWNELFGAWDIVGREARARGHDGAGAGGAALGDPTMTILSGHRATFDIEVTFRIDSTDVRPIFFANSPNEHVALGTGLHGLGVMVGSDFGQVRLYREQTIIGTAPIAVAAGTDYRVRLTFDGTTFQAKLWPAAGPEPASYTVSAAAVDVPAGQDRMAIGANVAGTTTRTLWFDNLIER